MTKFDKFKTSFAIAFGGKSLDDLMVELAQARLALQGFKADKAEIVAEMEAEYSLVLAEVGQQIEAAQATVEAAEEAVRNRSLAEFRATGERKPHPNVEVKQWTTLDYEVADAIDHCRQHLPGALKLDAKAFEKVARVADYPFVTIGYEHRASISQDLSILLEEGE